MTDRTEHIALYARAEHYSQMVAIQMQQIDAADNLATAARTLLGAEWTDPDLGPYMNALQFALERYEDEKRRQTTDDGASS